MEVAVDGVFFWLTGVGGGGRRRAVNDGGGDVQRTMPGTSGRVGERCNDSGRRLSTTTAAAAAAAAAWG